MHQVSLQDSQALVIFRGDPSLSPASFAISINSLGFRCHCLLPREGELSSDSPSSSSTLTNSLQLPLSVSFPMGLSTLLSAGTTGISLIRNTISYTQIMISCMTSSSCVARIEEATYGLSGMLGVRINLDASMGFFYHFPEFLTSLEICRHISDFGYPSKVIRFISEQDSPIPIESSLEVASPAYERLLPVGDSPLLQSSTLSPSAASIQNPYYLLVQLTSDIHNKGHPSTSSDFLAEDYIISLISKSISSLKLLATSFTAVTPPEYSNNLRSPISSENLSYFLSPPPFLPWTSPIDSITDFPNLSRYLLLGLPNQCNLPIRSDRWPFERLSATRRVWPAWLRFQKCLSTPMDMNFGEQDSEFKVSVSDPFILIILILTNLHCLMLLFYSG
ncbi:unnamed protein product [Protopolystoma xenopodis]|uniref:Uncharacterized protein n=1 Tax=Protopolystoma xenopodis TaxID=117903 RepID=A0A448WBY1_9PLAT|nr:unnamed protein product [Protopolystoma xenopodis]